MLSKAVAHSRISTASLVGGREEVSLSPGKDLRVPARHGWFQALRVPLSQSFHCAAACSLLLPGNCTCHSDVRLSRCASCTPVRFQHSCPDGFYRTPVISVPQPWCAGLCKAAADFSAALHRFLICHHFLNGGDQIGKNHSDFFWQLCNIQILQ